MRILVLFLWLALIVGCQSTTPEPIAAPKIFTHFEPTYEYTEPPEEQQTKTVSTTAKKVSPTNYVLKKPTQAPDLWQHIANNLNMKVYLNSTLKKRINWYLKQPNYLKIVNKRAAPYLYHIVKKVEKSNMPMELALLPFVESDFRPAARSSEHAVGVWQLVAATAHHFGIKSDKWYDGRQDVLAASDAALRYLRYLHKRFDGDWLLALAAYNSGEGRVQRAINYNKKRGKSTDYFALKLPKETADYVPKLLALSYLVKNPSKGLKRPKLSNRATTSIINIGQQFDFSVIAKLSDINIKTLHQLNPGYLKNQSSPKGPHTLILPIKENALFKNQFFKTNFSTGYKVKRNDTLYSIARQFSMSVHTLKELNNKKSNLIRVGENLQVSRITALPKNLTIDYNISPYLEPPEIIVPTVEINYQIKKGDSLWSISQQYNVPYSDLATWNKLTPSSVLTPGKILTVHIPQQPKPVQAATQENLLLDLQKVLNQPR
ncbi:LysM peptidoglycan-binding domain-containing protein [Pseudoalteromonas sp. MMG010]|uniref:LysM peptidoglycan-binding domain-containing protein n=1 Tax=Pseudoalteromonas sp. MMG010 TaxID=2822685 RepID=UPI001B39EB8E|nr:LysM peptidoglycan-binding domain-containing protein [Pseudoalteromonas sp. MMG010]MBQ4832740.1 LysM peptidoglycan-binding domain-containing protein [Pseudoalteromonas sp. MMG010]